MFVFYYSNMKRYCESARDFYEDSMHLGYDVLDIILIASYEFSGRDHKMHGCRANIIFMI